MVNQMVASGMLESLGIAHDTAENGEQAVQKWEATHYDLILMDFHMPVMDGRVATSVIREREKDNHTYTPIVALSADARETSIQANYESGMDDFISKPLLVDDLVRVIEKWAHGHSPRD